MDRAVVTLSIDFGAVSEITHPTLRAYAEKIGADFVVLDEKKVSTKYLQYEKFQLFDLFSKYKRILYLDSDITIRPDCPDLFELVPEHKLGLFNEGRYADMTEVMRDACKRYKTGLPKWERQSYNTGVMVLSRLHRQIFKKPDEEYDVFGSPVGVYHYEQPYLNLKVISEGYVVQELSHKFNRMSILDRPTGENHLDAYIVHYAGCPREHCIKLIKDDLVSWSSTAPEYRYKKNIRILVGGGLGDQVDAEPVVRYVCEKMHPGENIVVRTDYQDIFRHLPVGFEKNNVGPVQDPTIYYEMEALPAPTKPLWQFLAQTLCHTTDFSSISMLRRILPNEDKQIKIKVDLEDIASLMGTIGIRDLTKMVLVHPGKGWPSKTLPSSYWQDIIDGLVSLGAPVAVIGKYISEEQGLVDVQCGDGVLDLRNLLSFRELVALISQAKVLISNDSSPVHIAGAFDNYLILIPTCKHPEHVLPFRHGTQTYKSAAIYKKLVCDAINSSPLQVEGATVDVCPGNIEDYLADASEVVKVAEEFYSYE
jgi:hypothetical protein